MKTILKSICLFMGLLMFGFICYDKPVGLSSTDDIFGARDTLPYGSTQVGPAALRVIPGTSWRFWRLSDSTFAILSQDSSNSLQSVIREDSLKAWVLSWASTIGDSLSLSAYLDNDTIYQTLSISNDSLLISDGNGVSLAAYVQKKSATFIIASSTTTDSADYYCDNTSDQVQINAAISALPSSGGEIVLREGTYTVSAAITIPSTKRIILRGTGGARIVTTGNFAAISSINATQTGYGQQEDLKIENLRIEGNAGPSSGIYLENKHIAIIKDVVFVGDSLTGISLKKTNNIKITNCFFNRVKIGVYGLGGSSAGDDIEDIAIIGNDFSYCGRSAIHLESTSSVWQRDVSKISIIGNNIEESDFDKFYKFAIYLKNSKGATIVGNTITQTYRGGAIELQNGRLNIISSNVFRENGNAQTGSDSTSTVMLRSSNRNVFIGNTISQEYVDYGFTLISSDSNQFIGNISELDSISTYRFFGGSDNIVWSNGAVSGFDPSANIAFTGGNSFAGISTFNGANTYNNTELHTGVNTFNEDILLQKNSATGDQLSIKQSNAAGTYFFVESGGGGAAGIKSNAHGGTVASPTASAANQFLALWSARGHNGTALTTAAAGYWSVRAGALWTGSSNPTYQTWATTATNSTSAAVRMYLDNNGNLSIGSAAPASSAALDVQGTKALLLPRLTNTERNALTAVNGMIIYSTTDNVIQGYENGSWVDL